MDEPVLAQNLITGKFMKSKIVFFGLLLCALKLLQ